MKNYVLHRNISDKFGVFSTLYDNGKLIAYTAEHAYLQKDNKYLPKLPDGKYNCVKGTHVLESGPINTFEVKNVPNCTGILFHKGNFPQKDSEGCILVGRVRGYLDGIPAVLSSRSKFLELLNMWGNDDFMLIVK